MERWIIYTHLPSYLIKLVYSETATKIEDKNLPFFLLYTVFFLNVRFIQIFLAFTYKMFLYLFFSGKFLWRSCRFFFLWLFTNFHILIHSGKITNNRSKCNFPKENNIVLYLFLQENSAGDHVDFPFSGYWQTFYTSRHLMHLGVLKS